MNILEYSLQNKNRVVDFSIIGLSLKFLNVGIKTYKYHLHKTVSKKNYIAYFSENAKSALNSRSFYSKYKKIQFLNSFIGR